MLNSVRFKIHFLPSNCLNTLNLIVIFYLILNTLVMYTKMPMQLSTSPAIRNYINTILGSISGRSQSLVILDDLLLNISKHGPSKELEDLLKALL